MSMGSRIKEARSRAGFTQEQLAALLEVSKGAVGNYENDTNYPKAEMVTRLCAVLKCDPNYLYQDDVEPAGHFQVAFPERAMLKKYRSLDDHGKDMVDTVLSKEYERCMEKPLPVRSISILMTEYPAAAGDPLDANSNFTRQDFQADVVPDSAEFGTPIFGDSMAPKYPNGCMVFWRRTKEVRNGDVVVATLRGEGTVCKRAVTEGDRLLYLHSDNEAYPDITGERLNDIEIHGVVVGSTI